MNNIVLLTIVFLKSSLQRIQSKYYENAEKNKKIRKMAFIILSLILIAMIGVFSSNIIDLLMEFEQESLFPGVILILVLIMTVIQVIFSGVSILYFTKDTEYILPLPLKPYQILIARTNVIILIQYFIEMIIGLVPLVVYGYKMNLGPMYYVPVLISLLLLPIIPIILVSILIMILMTFSKITKNKNKFQLIITLLLLALMIVFSITMYKIENIYMTNEQMAQMVSEADNIIEKIKEVFPTLKYCINAILSNNVLTMAIEFIKVIAITIISYIVYTLLSQKLYFKGLVGSLFSGERKKKFKKVNIKIKNKGIGKRYIQKEFKTLVRNPIFLSQCILPGIILPILCVVLLYISLTDEEIISNVLNYLNQIKAEGMVLLLLIGITQFFSMTINISILAISKDGINAYFMKYIPLNLYKQYIYKIIPSIFINLFQVILVIIAGKYFLDISILNIIVVFVVSMIMIIAQNFLSLIADLKGPKLKWDSEYAVAKQNFNLIFPIIFSLINILILIVYAESTQTKSVYLILGLISAVYLIVIALSNVYLYKKQYELAGKIE